LAIRLGRFVPSDNKGGVCFAIANSQFLTVMGGSRLRKLLVGLRKPINRGSALCGLAGRVAATETPP
jgi:hypothetical protein